MLWEKMKSKTNKNAKMDKIFGCGNTAMKLGTGGEKRLFCQLPKRPDFSQITTF